MKNIYPKFIAVALSGAMAFGVPAFGSVGHAQAEGAGSLESAAIAAQATERNTDLADGTYTIGAKSNFYMFKVYRDKNDSSRNQAKLIVRDGVAQIRFRLAGSGYDALYLGSTADAKTASDDQLIKYEEVNEGTDSYGIPYDFYYFQFPVVLKQGQTKDITFAARGTRSGKWFSQTITVTTKYLALKPVRVSGVKAKSSKTRQARVSWKKISKNSTGYQVSISLKKNFKRATIKKVDGAKRTSVTVKKLKKGKTYYVRVRATNKNDYSTVQGAWSTVKTVKVK